MELGTDLSLAIQRSFYFISYKANIMSMIKFNLFLYFFAFYIIHSFLEMHKAPRTGELVIIEIDGKNPFVVAGVVSRIYYI